MWETISGYASFLILGGPFLLVPVLLIFLILLIVFAALRSRHRKLQPGEKDAVYESKAADLARCVKVFGILSIVFAVLAIASSAFTFFAIMDM